MHSRICSLDIDLHYSCFQGVDSEYFLEWIKKIVEKNKKCIIFNITFIMDNYICSRKPRYAEEMEDKITEMTDRDERELKCTYTC